MRYNGAMKNQRRAGDFPNNFRGFRDQRGLIKTVVIIVIALLILSYFGFSLRNLVNQPTTQDNFSYAGSVVMNVWNNYLKTPATYIWNIFIDFIWNPALEHLKHVETVDLTATSTPRY